MYLSIETDYFNANVEIVADALITRPVLILPSGRVNMHS